LYKRFKDERYFETNFDPIFEEGDVDENGGVDDVKYNAAMSKGLKAYEQGIHGNIIQDVVTYLSEGNIGWVESVEEYEKRKNEEELKRMDALASKYAKVWNCNAGDKQFINMLLSTIDELNDRHEQEMSDESRRERWAACQYAGASHSFWSDEDFIENQYSSEFEELTLVMSWIERNCPLTLLTIKEKRMTE
jgi:hypothetical protein